MSRSHRRAAAATTTAATAPRWLTAAQLEAWQAITQLLGLLSTALEAQLQRDAQLSYVEYYVLAGLSDQPKPHHADQRARRVHQRRNLTLSHLISRLQKRGYVRREPDPTDGRYTNAVLTDAGYSHLVAAAPGHVAAVLELVIDALDDTALSALQDSAERIIARINDARAVSG